MSVTLHVDESRWRANLDQVTKEFEGLVPVAKGNGYGFGLPRLAEEATALGVDTLAIGTYEEFDSVTGFAGDIVVLTPWRPFDHRADDRIIHTVGRIEDIEQVEGRVLLERMTSMRRFGFSAAELREGAEIARSRGLQVEGVSIHLPLHGAYGQMDRLMTDVVAAGLDGPIWVSHLSAAELARVRTNYPDFNFRPRIGTKLWLGDRGAMRVTATVLDAHPIERGETYGYRGRTAPRTGTILIVSGGTAHGIGLEAPTGETSIKARAAAIARGGLDATGFVRSPYTVAGKQRLFAEPPHMQASMLFLPDGSDVPSVGAEVDVRVRYTATTFDRVSFG